MRFSTKEGFYELNPFPGCNQVVISNHAFIAAEHRGMGLGKKQHTDRLEKIKELHYDYALCSVNASNRKEIHILNTNGWKLLDTFHNKETTNMVELWGKRMDGQ